MSIPPFPEPEPGWQPPPMPPGVGMPGPPPYGYPYAGAPIDMQAPYGRDPFSGELLSDKSAVVAGCLQLFFGCFGVGRFYLGSTNTAVIQLCLGLFGFFTTMFCLVGLPLLVASSIWGLVDAIMIFTGSVRDPYGRKLRS
jgi:TM2 domain-containing membrane protein YozV